MSYILDLPNISIDPTYYSIIKDTCIELIGGSRSYHTDIKDSDYDIYGIFIPPKDILFPFQNNVHIFGFDNQPKEFGQYNTKIIYEDGITYEITFYNIVKFFNLCMQNNPNLIDLLFTSENDILYSNSIGEKILKNKKIFLSKACYPKFKGYAYSQLSKLRSKKPEGNRVKIIEKYGFDTKYAMHIVRLLDECEQILTTGDLDIKKNYEFHTAIRMGSVPLKDIETLFSIKEKQLEWAFQTSNLPEKPNKEKIKELLLECIT